MSLEIGKKGQNVRLAAKLTGWRIDIKSEEEKRKEVEAQLGALEVPAEENDAVAETADAVQTTADVVETPGEAVESAADETQVGEETAAAEGDTETAPAEENNEESR